MYSIHSCPQGRSIATHPARKAGVVIHLRENRSSLPREARQLCVVLIGLFMAMAILPALSGEILVPVYALSTMGLLVGALEWHRRSQPAAESLSILGDRLIWSSPRAPAAELPRHATRLICDQPSPSRLRLLLECRWQRIEIGRCLSLDEKRAVAALIARELGEADA